MLGLTLRLRWSLNVNVDLSTLRLSRCPGVLPDYGRRSVMIKWRSSPPWSLSLFSPFSLFFSLLLSLASSVLSKLSLFFLITASDLDRNFGSTSASLGIEKTVPAHNHCVHTLFTASIKFTWSPPPPFHFTTHSYIHIYAHLPSNLKYVLV